MQHVIHTNTSFRVRLSAGDGEKNIGDALDMHSYTTNEGSYAYFVKCYFIQITW